MNIKKLSLQEIGELNEFQKYFYEHSQVFVEKLSNEYFDPDKTFYKVSNSQGHACLELRLTTREMPAIFLCVYISYREIVVAINDGWHENIDYQNKTIGELYDNLEKLLFFCLSKSCKVITHKSNGRPYKWDLYAFEDSGWKLCSTMGLLFYNFFGKRTQEAKQSTIFDKAIYPKELFAG